MKSEFEFIRQLRNKSNPAEFQPKIKKGIGDDCAVIKQSGNFDLVITTDLLVEDVDFRLKWTKPEFIGHKSLAVSLSDVAAMGGKPVWALVSIGVPVHLWKTDFIEKFYSGWFQLAEQFNVQLIGGDVSKTPDKLVIDSIVAGEVKNNRAILRSTAQTEDLIFVTGSLGAAAAGLRLLENAKENKEIWQNDLIQKQLTPFPQISIAAQLAKFKLATAMIDLSDGLSSDLLHLCEESKVGARIEANKIPLAKNLNFVLKDGEDELSFALNGGEDFELLFTAHPKHRNKLEKLFGDQVTCIGKITDEVGKIELISDLTITEILPQGFRHF